MNTKKQDVYFVLFLQFVLFVLFAIFATYNQHYEENINTYSIVLCPSCRLKMQRIELYCQKIKKIFYFEKRGFSNPIIDRIHRFKLGLIIFFAQSVICLCFTAFCQYAPQLDASDAANAVGPTYGGFKQKQVGSQYHLFQDVHVMIFIGFGFLMTFLRRYGYSAVGFNFLLGALIIQWAILCQGFYALNENYHMVLGIESLYEADIAAAAVLISMGAVLGRTSYIQLMIMGLMEIAVFSANSHLGLTVFQVSDAGGSIFVHTFGAYFGLAVSYVIDLKKEKSETGNSLEGARYTSDLFAMIGTIFLWLYWPSFNAIELTGDDQQRAVINTYLSLASCCVTSFAFSLLLTENNKFDMVHIQNSTLAGGVAVGASANLMLQPFGAILIGIIAGILSVAGYAKLTPYLTSKFGLRDTCGVHNLHGMPGVLAGLIGALMAGIASESTYNYTLYEIYPARAAPNMTATSEYTFLTPGVGRNAPEQAGYQVLAVVVTVCVATFSGLITGFMLSCTKLNTISSEQYYDDSVLWHLPENAISPPPKRNSAQAQFDNPAFIRESLKNTHVDIFN